MKNIFSRSVVWILALGFPFAVQAIGGIPEESGFSGSITLGAGALDYKSNTVVGTTFFDAGDDTIADLGSPDSNSTGLPVFSYDLRYTFADSKTQLFAGNLLPDFLSFDFATKFGVRREFGDVGIMGIAYLRSVIPTEVWEDPYLVGSKRDDTDRTSNGFSITWEKIFNSKFTIELRSRDIDIDDELSGQSLVPPLSDPKGSLSREGDQNSLEVLYEYGLDKNNIIVPSFTYIDFDLDGNAMRKERYLGQLSYLYTGSRYNFVGNLVYGTDSYDKSNPVFGEKNDADVYGISATLFYKQPFSMKNWQAMVGAAYFNEDTDIGFYETEATLVNIGMMYRF